MYEQTIAIDEGMMKSCHMKYKRQLEFYIIEMWIARLFIKPA